MSQKVVVTGFQPSGTLHIGNYLGAFKQAIELQKKPVSAGEVTKEMFRIPSEGIILEELEKNLIQQAYENAHHNQTEGARLLGLSRDVFRYKLKKYGYI